MLSIESVNWRRASCLTRVTKPALANVEIKQSEDDNSGNRNDNGAAYTAVDRYQVRIDVKTPAELS